MKTIIACLIGIVLFVFAGASTLVADEIEAPNGIYVKGCPEYILVDNRVRQLCEIDNIPPRNFLSVTEFNRAFRGAGNGSQGGSEEIGSTSD